LDYSNFDFIAATRGEELIFVKNDVPFAFKKKHGLLSDQLTSIFVDSSHTIWIGSSEGLSILSPNKGIINLTIEDGLISNEVTAIFVNETHAYIGTKKGLTVLDKNKINRKLADIPFIFRSITKDEKTYVVNRNDEIQLKYKEPILNIKFAGIYYK
jgi:ligand-binding sensor domain-containing protein